MNLAMATCNNCRHSYPDTALFCPTCGTAKVRADGDVLLGKVLGERFLVQERIGQGTSGTIYRAEHVTLRRKVAIKVLHAELARDDLAVERFRREATMVAEVDNEHIVEIHDFGRAPDGRLYLAMEMLEGETLDEVLRREGKLSVDRTADILIQLGEALMEAHAVGYVHRDLRPRNIYLAVRRGKPNFVKLLDFGLSKLVESDSHAASTSLGMTFGDPRYMSPEQARGDRIDRRADIYQLGCISYEMLTGAPPFSGARVFDVLSRHVTEAPAPLPSQRPDVPLWMEAAVARMLAKRPDDRFATTSRLVEALRRGVEHGEVMDDAVARQRETIPPASVSRAMERMGVSGEPAPAAAAAPAPAPAMSKTISTSIAPPPAASRPPAAAVPAPERRRTGTPRVGLPAVTGPSTGQQLAAPAPSPSKPAVAAVPVAAAPAAPKASAPVLDGPPQMPPPAVSAALSSSAARSAATEPQAEPGVSQVWFEDDDAPARRRGDARTNTSSTTDLFLHHQGSGRRKTLIAVIGGGLLAVGGLAFALSRSGGAPEPAAVAPVVAAAPTPAPAPASEPAPAVAVTAPPVVSAPPPVAAPVEVAKDTSAPLRPSAPRSSAPPARAPRTPPSIAVGEPSPTGDDPLLRRSSSGAAKPASAKPPDKPAVEPPSSEPPGAGAGVSGGEGTLDPYGGDAEAVPQPIKQAEELATQGQQAMQRGDLASAAASFKKAVELDGKNLLAVAGLGEIALQQGLFGDAVAHLRKAAKLAPRSARVHTLLGEALLNSGDAAAAADAFKRALQLAPDSTRARDGYNDATARAGTGAESP